MPPSSPRSIPSPHPATAPSGSHIRRGPLLAPLWHRALPYLSPSAIAASTNLTPEHRSPRAPAPIRHGRRVEAHRAPFSISSPLEPLAPLRRRLGGSRVCPFREEDDRVFLVPRRWWEEALEGVAMEASGVPYTVAPVGPTSYGMKVFTMFISD